MTHTVGITSVHCESAFINGTQSQTPKVRGTKPHKASVTHLQRGIIYALTASSFFGIANRIKSILSGAFWKNVCSGCHSDDESADAPPIDCMEDFSI